MEQQVIVIAAGLLTVAGFVLYPHLMISLVIGFVRGVFNLIADCIALLFAWI